MVEIDNRAILVMLFIIVMGMMAIYAGSDDPANLEASSELDINETESSEDSSVQENNLTGETREIYGSSEEREQESEEAQEKEGIALDTQPVAGESNRIILYENGERVSQEKIYINDEDIGQTNNAGALRFTTPNTKEITITTENSIAQKTSYVENYENHLAEVNLISPSTNEEIQDFKPQFNFGIETDNTVKYEFYIEDRIVNSGEVENNLNYIDEHVIEESGQSSWGVKIEDQEGNTEQYERELITVEDMPEITFDINSPQDEEIIEHYKADFSFEADSKVDYIIELIIDGSAEHEVELDAGQTISSLQKVFEESGEHEWKLKATVRETGKEFTSEKRTLTTTQNPPAAEINAYSPDGSETEPITDEKEIGLDFSAENFEEAEYTVFLSQNDGEATIEDEGNLNEVRTHGITTDKRAFDAANYRWWIEVEGKETGETETSEELTFEVVED